MGKTKRVFTANHKDSFVTLQIRGPKFIIGRNGPRKVRANLNTTWLTLFRDVLKVDMPLDLGIYLTSHNRCTQIRNLWRTELTNPVRDYINKYMRKKRCYTVCVRCPLVKGHQKSLQAVRSKRQQNDSSAEKNEMPPPPPPPAVMLPPAEASTSRLSGYTVPPEVTRFSSPQGSETSDTPIQIRSVESRSQEDSLEVEGDIEWDRDGSSVASSASKESELQRRGIQSENLKLPGTIRFSKNDNTTLLLVRDEFADLVQRDSWRRFKKRAPRCSLFLQDIFGIASNN